MLLRQIWLAEGMVGEALDMTLDYREYVTAVQYLEGLE